MSVTGAKSTQLPQTKYDDDADGDDDEHLAECFEAASISPDNIAEYELKPTTDDRTDRNTEDTKSQKGTETSHRSDCNSYCSGDLW